MSTDPSAPKRILVADDDEDGRVLTAYVLQDAGFDVESAVDGQEALEKIRAHQPDLVVLDLMMPKIDGWTVLEQIRRGPDAPPVVVLTARVDYDTLARGAREGAVAYLSKPFRFEDLIAICRKLLAAGAEKPPAVERRGSARRVFMVEVELPSEPKSPAVAGQLANISLGGAQVDLRHPLGVGTRVSLAFNVPGGAHTLKLQGQVRWQASSPPGFAHGLAFVDLTPDVEKRLRELLPA